MKNCSIQLYALSTCIHCKKTKEYLDKCNVHYNCTYVDQTSGDERRALMGIIKEYNPSLSFPTMVIKEENGTEQVIVGFKEEKINEVLCL